MRATLRSLSMDPDPASLSAAAEDFMFRARVLVGPSDAAGEESFDAVVATPQWLSEQCRLHSPFGGRHHVFVDFESFDARELRRWFDQRVSSFEADTWPELAVLLSQIGHWEFEGYRS